jgi:hypothetical protein
MLIPLLFALHAADVSYLSVRDDSFGFMRAPQTITASAVIRANDPRVPAFLRALQRPAAPTPIAENLQIPLSGHNAKDLRNAYFHNYFTDTGDTVTARLQLRDGRTISVVSNSQMLLMLPWVTYVLTQPAVTYDAGLTRAIVALLPKSAPSYELLLGRGDMGWPQPGDVLDLSRVYSAEGTGSCFRQYGRDHAGVSEHIHIEGNLSLPFYAQEQFLADQYRAGRTDIIDNVAGQLQLYTWVTLRSKSARTDWVSGPNNLGTFLWRHSGNEILGLERLLASGFKNDGYPCS